MYKKKKLNISAISKFALMEYQAEDELNLFSFEYGKLKDA